MGFIKDILELIEYILKFYRWLKDKIFCSNCRGKGKIECDCIKVWVLGHSVSSLTKSKDGHYILEINGVSIVNESAKREISLQLSVEFKHDNLLSNEIKPLSIKRRIDGIVVGNGSNQIEKDKLSNFRIDFGDCRQIEEFLGKKELTSADFNTRIEVIDITPNPNCNKCKGTGFIKCPKCAERFPNVFDRVYALFSKKEKTKIYDTDTMDNTTIKEAINFFAPLFQQLSTLEENKKEGYYDLSELKIKGNPKIGVYGTKEIDNKINELADLYTKYTSSRYLIGAETVPSKQVKKLAEELKIALDEHIYGAYQEKHRGIYKRKYQEDFKDEDKSKSNLFRHSMTGSLILIGLVIILIISVWGYRTIDNYYKSYEFYGNHIEKHIRDIGLPEKKDLNTTLRIDYDLITGGNVGLLGHIDKYEFKGKVPIFGYDNDIEFVISGKHNKNSEHVRLLGYKIIDTYPGDPIVTKHTVKPYINLDSSEGYSFSIPIGKPGRHDIKITFFFDSYDMDLFPGVLIPNGDVKWEVENGYTGIIHKNESLTYPPYYLDVTFNYSSMDQETYRSLGLEKLKGYGILIGILIGIVTILRFGINIFRR